MAKTQHEVEVILTAETAVSIVVWVDDGEGPADLQPDEKRLAIERAGPTARWTVAQARVVD